MVSAMLLAGALAGTASAESLWENASVTPAPVKFSGTTASEVQLKLSDGYEFGCSKGNIKGEFATSKEVWAEEQFKECSGGLGNSKGEFFTTTLRGTVGLYEGYYRVGLELGPAEGSIWATNFYFDAPLTNKLIGGLEPLGTETSKLTLTYAANSGGVQLPNHFDTQPHMQLEFEEKPMTIRTEWAITTEKPVKVELW